MGECPCCGQTLPLDLPAGLVLTRKQQQVYEVIRKAGRNGVYGDQIFDRVYADDPNGGPNTQTKIISVFVHGLNKKLPAFGQTIKSGEWGGVHSTCAKYWLVALDA